MLVRCGTLACKPGADESTCLTPAQVEAVKKVHDGAKNPRTGEQIFTGWPRGSENFGDAAIMGWRQYITDMKEPSRVGVFKYWLFNDPNWDVRTLDYDRDFAYTNERLPHMHAVDRDLTPFKKSGGKLISYAGWMDPVVPPQDTAAYYEGVAKVMGGYDKTRDFYPPVHGARHGPLRRRSRARTRSMRSPRSRTGSRKASRRTS